MRPVVGATFRAGIAAGTCLTLLLSSCGQRSTEQNEPQSTPFVFQALNLRQQNAQGQLLWQVKSPEARYDLGRRLALARNLRGEIYTNGQPLYRLQSSHGTVLSDGEVIQLEGLVMVERLGRDPVMIKASRMRWYPRQQRIELDRQARAYDQTLQLSAAKATLLIERDLLQLRGQPLLQSRQPLAGGGVLRLQLRQVDWSPVSGTLVAPGAVRATSSGSNGQQRSLQAAGINGNSLSRRLNLQGPVRLELPDRNAWLAAQTTTLNLNDNSLDSPAPFTAAVGPLNINGLGLRLNLSDSQAEIVAGCRLVQPDAALSAQSCRWNWRTEQIEASGGVVLKRVANRQTTRAQQLNGRIGPSGLLVFSSPGSRVRSTLVLPRAQGQQQKRAAAIRL